MLIGRSELKGRFKVRLLSLFEHMGCNQLIHVLSLLLFLFSILFRPSLGINRAEVLELEFIFLMQYTIVSNKSALVISRIGFFLQVLLNSVLFNLLLTS